MVNVSPDKQDTDSGRRETLLMVIIVVVAACLVWFVWHSKQVADKNLTATNPANPAFRHSTTPPAAKTPATPAQRSAVDLVQTAFRTADTYASNNSADASQGEVDAIKSSLSPSLYSELSASLKTRSQYDPILCAQEFPDGINASLVGIKGETATVVVTESFGQSQQHITTTVDLGSQQLTGISCPAAPGS